MPPNAETESAMNERWYGLGDLALGRDAQWVLMFHDGDRRLREVGHDPPGCIDVETVVEARGCPWTCSIETIAPLSSPRIA